MDYHFSTISEQDGEGILQVFNYFVENSYAAYGEIPSGLNLAVRFLEKARDYPSIVVKTPAMQTVGFSFLHAYHPAATLKQTAEIVYFILPEHTRRGLGTRILRELIEAARARGIEILLAQISSLNEQSISFHLKNGFEQCGRLPGIGRKWGNVFDVIWMFRRI